MSQLDQMMTSGPLPPSRHRGPVARWAVGLVLVGLLALVIIGAMRLVGVGLSTGTPDYEGPGHGSVSVTVARGASLTSMGQVLLEAGVVSSVDAFVAAAEANPDAGKIGPGGYTLRLQMGADEAVALMLDPVSRADSRLVLPEGLRLTQTVEVSAKQTGIPKADFDKVLQSPSGLGLPKWADGEPEGFMFPATYDVAGDETAEQMLTAFVRRFDETAERLALVDRAGERGLSPYEVLTVASIVQAEVHEPDFKKAAAVIYNRLDAGMPLQMDSTVAYGLDTVNIQLSAEQLKQDTPFNTYMHQGLPPTPINSPGEAAIEAALSPGKGKWLYFVTVNPQTGETKFAKTYEEFLKLKREFQEAIGQ